MNIAKAKIYSKKFGAEEWLICNQRNKEDIANKRISIERPLAKAIKKAGIHGIKKFDCNGILYELIYYQPLNEEGKKVTNDFTKYKNPKTICIYKYCCICKTCLNKFYYPSIENRNAIVYSIQKEKVTIDVQYCKHCYNYYIDEQSLTEYEQKYGILLFNRGKREIDGWSNNSNFDYKPNTILSRNGYSTNLDRKTRRGILSKLIEEETCLKCDIKGILAYFIYTRSKRCKQAALIWKEDLLFVNQYNSENQKTYENFLFREINKSIN